LSHNKRDKAVVEPIGAWLHGRGLRVWFDQWKLRPGFPWQEGLEEGIRASKAGAIFVGVDGLGDWQTTEMRAFLARSRRVQVAVIPVLLPGCPDTRELGLFLEAFTSVDLRQGVTEDGLGSLVWGITGVKPEGPSQSPPERVSVSSSASFLHNLPYPSLGPLFQGRDEWLTVLHQSLAGRPAGRATAIAGKAVHGLGGVGKTRLAVEYAWRYAGEYRAAFFVAAESPADLRRNLAALCGPTLLNLPEQAATDETIREAAVLRRLREAPGWLLIVDNVDTEEAALAVDGLLVQLQGGHVLLTGRYTRWSVEVETFALDLLAPEEARAFLLARTKSWRRFSADEESQASEIARELGYLPLALEQAGAFIAARRLTFAGYLEIWRTSRARALEWFDPRLSHYPASLAVTWQAAVDRLTHPARLLLQRLAWFGPEPIPESLLEVPVCGPAVEELGPSPFDLLVELETYSLAIRSIETAIFSVHRLVQDVTRCSLVGDPAKKVLDDALQWVNGAFVGNPQDVRTWPLLEPLAPHARTVVEFADQAALTGPTSRLMNELGQLYHAKALFREAEPLMRRALALDESSFGPKEPEVARDLNNLAQLLFETSRLTEAESLMRRALAIDEASFGPEEPEVARDLNNLAQLLHATDRLTEAESLMRRALAIDEARVGPDHPRVAAHLNNLAQLLQETDRREEAEPLMRRALVLDEMSFGPEHPNVATNLSNLAMLLQDGHRLSEAEPLMRRAIAIDEKSLGSEHPEVATKLNNLAQLLKEMNRRTEAEPLLRRAVEVLGVFKHRTGYTHPNYDLVVSNYRTLRKTDEASSTLWTRLYSRRE
jgi:tetratricopeptide (TPR) repeat protein